VCKNNYFKCICLPSSLVPNNGHIPCQIWTLDIGFVTNTKTILMIWVGAKQFQYPNFEKRPWIGRSSISSTNWKNNQKLKKIVTSLGH